MANGRCRLHGGLTPAGPASPHWKHGQDSRWGGLPKGLAERYLRSRSQLDRELLALTDDIALVEAQISEVLGKAMKRESLTEAQSKKLERLMEQRRKLVETETRRRKDTAETLSLQQGMALVSMLASAVRETISNLQERAELTRRLQKLLKAPAGDSEVIPPVDGSDFT